MNCYVKGGRARKGLGLRELPKKEAVTKKIMGERIPNDHLKRAACHIASQLPDDSREALVVLNFAREIICNLGKAWEIQSPMPEATPFIRLVSERHPKDQEVS